MGSAPTFGGSFASSASVTSGASAVADRAVKGVFTISTDGTHTTTVVIENDTSFAGGGTCLARAQIYQVG